MDIKLTQKLKSLPSYIETLSIWDIDDTLFVSPDTYVYVIKNNKIVHKLKTNEFNSYRLKPGEAYDFSEFRDGNIFFNTAKPLSANLKKAKQELQSNKTFLLVLTARSDLNDKNKFLKKFEMYGLDLTLPISHVVRSGNLGMSTAKGKKTVLQEILKIKKFKKVIMYDDHSNNLDALLSVDTKETEFSAYIVKNGKIKKYADI